MGGAEGGGDGSTLMGMKPIDESEEASLIWDRQPVGLVDRLQHQLSGHLGRRAHANQGASSSSTAPSDSHVHAARGHAEEERYVPLYEVEERSSSTM